jgi:CubicO group peptidase (beta-lactamase class C family)
VADGTAVSGLERASEVEVRTTVRSIGVVAALVVVVATAAVAENKAKAIDALIDSYQQAGSFNGAALVGSGGKVVLSKGYGYADFEWKIANTPDTKFRLGSITKQFTATIIMQLVEEGKLSTTMTLADALPYYRKDTGAKVTIHHLLNHTSGIPSYTGLPGFMQERSRDPYEVREFVQTFCRGDLEFEPGSKFLYNNSGYFILGAIIEQVTQKSYTQVLQERILTPLGMQATGYDLSGPILEKRARGYERTDTGVRNADYLDMSIPYAAGSLYSTVGDLFTWDQALYTEKVLPSKALALMFTPGLDNYGYGWGIRKRPFGANNAEQTVISHGGGINGFNTLIVRVPDDRVTVILLNNTGRAPLDALATGIVDILRGRTPAPPKARTSS